ncbi:hypothetical protein [Streptomyces sp. NRRL F-4428]|uniref:hypothetical protein n=1 Tax=Streptomyces sp. NRRL F-4428 TaxID=1609137 RepID=UPI001F350008|nr:hypothetical protein [Streptomyces sp. NRRL F-4428]
MFVCAGCGTELTAPVSRVALPDHTHHGAWERLHPPLMEPATYAVETRPTGPPWRLWDDVGEDLAARQGVYLPQYAVSFGSRGRVVIAPGDSRGMALIPDRCEGYCMGIDGRDGPNLACRGCGRAVATRMDDCGLWQTVWLEPDEVRCVPSGAPAVPVPGWDELDLGACAVAPVELDGSWSFRWEAAVMVALARLVVACEGRPVTLPGPLADLVGDAVAGFLPAGGPALAARLAGPGTPVLGPGGDVLLVPRHPVTGESWRPPDGTAPVVPMDIGVWAHLTLPGEASPLPATGTLPDGVLRDDYPRPLRPGDGFWPHQEAFRGALAHLPGIRHPQLLAYRERYGARPR